MKMFPSEVKQRTPKPIRKLPSPPKPPKPVVPEPAPCTPCSIFSRPGAKKPSKFKLSKKKLDFDYLGQKDDFIEEVAEHYDRVLPPLSPRQVSPRSPCRPPPQLPVWKTPEEIERMVSKPKPRTPSPPYVVPEMKPHEWFQRTPPAADLGRAMLAETPPAMAPSPPPASPRRTPSPRPRTISPLPEVFGQTPPYDMSFEEDVCIPCSPLGGSPGRADDIFAQAGISPGRPPPPTPPPSPPSPFSTDQAMQQTISRVKAAEGKSGIVRPGFMWFDTFKDVRPMAPITEVTTRPEIGTFGLPGTVQVDPRTLGTGQREEAPYVRSAYVPPPRRPPCQALSPDVEEEQEEEEEDRFGSMICGPPSPQFSPRELQRVGPTSPLAQFQQRELISPPRRSPTLPRAVGAPMLEQMDFSFEELDAFERTPTTPIRTPQVTPKPSPYLSPCASPRHTPPSRPVFSPQFPPQRPDDILLSQISGSMPGSPEFFPESPCAPCSPQVSPQYVAPTWDSSASSVEQEQDEMGLPGVVQMHVETMPAVCVSPTAAQTRQRRLITFQDQPPSPTRPQMIHPAADIQMDALPIPEEPIQMHLPVAPLAPFVPQAVVSPPIRYDLSPPFPTAGGPMLDEPYDMDALYAGEYGAFEVYEAASIPSVGTPSPCRVPSRSPSPRTPPIPRSPPGTLQRWDQMVGHTPQRGILDTSLDYAASPEQLSPCVPCGTSPMRQPSPPRSPVRSPMTVRSPPMRSPAAQVARSPPRAPSPQMVRSPPARRPSPQAVRRPSPQAARPPTPTARSPVQAARSPIRTPSSSPIVMPELSPFRMPQPSPPCVPCGAGSPAAAARRASPPGPERVVKQTMTERKIVTVIPPRPTIPLEYEGEIIEPSGAADRSDGDMQEDDTDFRWMDHV